MAMKQLKAKHDAAPAPVPASDMPPEYYLESNRPYATQAAQFFAKGTTGMMRDSFGEEPSESAKQMYEKSAFDYYMNDWHRSGRDIAREIRDDTIRIGGHAREDIIDARMAQYSEILQRRGKNDMLGACERSMFKQNVSERVAALRCMDVPYRAAAVSELYKANGQNANSLILQTIWKQEAAVRQTSGRKLPSVGEDLLAQQEANLSVDYGDYGD